MGNLFSDTQGTLLRFGYERLPYTFYTAALQPGSTTVFNIINLAQATQNKAIAILGNFAATNAAAISYFLHTQRNIQSPLAGLPNLAPIMNAGPDSGVRSLTALELTLLNATATTPMIQVNYTGAVKRMTIADKVLQNAVLTPQEAQIAEQLGLKSGASVPSIQSVIDNAWLSQVRGELPYSYVTNVTAGETTLATVTAGNDELIVLTKIGAAAPVGNQVTINITRDGDENYASILADNMSVTAPFDVWLPAQTRLVFRISAVTATASVPVWFTVLRIRYSDVLRALAGTLVPSTAAQQSLVSRVEAGVLV